MQIDIPQGELPPSAAQAQMSWIGKSAFPLALAAIAAILLGLVLSILKMNHGVFLYTMDDPYIGLALSDQIRHGNYGLNSGMPAAPDSSILYPLLLAPASGTPLHPYLPLILNTLALFATLAIVWRLFAHLRLAQDTFGIVALAAALLLMAIFLNLIGVVFTGLEHSLHIAVVAATIYGLALFLDSGTMPRWLPAAIVVAPLLRFEGLALSFAALLVLLLRGRWRTALGSLAIILILVGGFPFFLVHLGLPPLPSSVLTKSMVAANGISGAGYGFFGSIGINLLLMVSDRVGIMLIAIGVAAAARCYRELPARPSHWSSQGLMALLLLCLIGAHSVAGRLIWFDDRYEDYVLLGTALIGACLFRDSIRKMLLNSKKSLKFFAATAIVLAVIFPRYLLSTARIPIASSNIFEQQFQMQRFVSEFYRGPVAVNDLGLISYHNPRFVLDLGGLASEKARILRARAASAEEYRAFVAGSGVRLAIIYDEWFPGQIPASWIKVASMDLSRERVSASEAEVQFYATDTLTASQLQPELESFRKGLPPGVKLTVYAAGADGARSAAVSR
ncbi:MAG: hypothetical protein ABR991_01320 [Terracidiphilus sp.]|jgi:hypothetical protein